MEDSITAGVTHVNSAEERARKQPGLRHSGDGRDLHGIGVRNFTAFDHQLGLNWGRLSKPRSGADPQAPFGGAAVDNHSISSSVEHQPPQAGKHSRSSFHGFEFDASALGWRRCEVQTLGVQVQQVIEAGKEFLTENALNSIRELADGGHVGVQKFLPISAHGAERNLQTSASPDEGGAGGGNHFYAKLGLESERSGQDRVHLIRLSTRIQKEAVRSMSIHKHAVDKGTALQDLQLYSGGRFGMEETSRYNDQTEGDCVGHEGTLRLGASESRDAARMVC